MAMGRRRQTDKHLPRHVYRKGQTFYYYPPKGKWTRLGKTMPEVYRELSRVAGQGGYTVSDMLDRYINEVLPKKSQNTQRNRLWQADKLKATFGPCHPDDITSQDIYQYLDKRSKKVSANREISFLSAVYVKAIRWGVATQNPCKDIEYHEEKPRDRYVTDAEFWAVWEIAPVRVQLFMELAYITGQRLSDVLNMKWSDVTDDGLLVRQGKTGRKLCITVSDALQDVFRRAKDRKIGSLYILADDTGQKVTHFTMGGAFRRAVVKALEKGKLSERYTLHDIRAKAGSDSTGEVLGHMDQRTLFRIYKRKPSVVAPVY